MQYTLIDQYDNLTTIERYDPPITIGWEYIVQECRYGGRTQAEAEQVMVRQVAAKTPYRGFIQIAKHLGYHLVSLDKEGNAYLRSGNVPQGPFKGEDEGPF